MNSPVILHPFVRSSGIHEYAMVVWPAQLSGGPSKEELYSLLGNAPDSTEPGTAYRCMILNVDGQGMQVVWRSAVSNAAYWGVEKIADPNGRPVCVIEGFLCTGDLTIVEDHFEAVHCVTAPVFREYLTTGKMLRDAVDPVLAPPCSLGKVVRLVAPAAITARSRKDAAGTEWRCLATTDVRIGLDDAPRSITYFRRVDKLLVHTANAVYTVDNLLKSRPTRLRPLWKSGRGSERISTLPQEDQSGRQFGVAAGRQLAVWDENLQLRSADLPSDIGGHHMQAISVNTELIATGSNREMVLWRREAMDLLGWSIASFHKWIPYAHVKFPLRATTFTVAGSPALCRTAEAYEDGTICIGTIHEVRPPVESGTLSINKLRFSPDGRYLLALGDDAVLLDSVTGVRVSLALQLESPSFGAVATDGTVVILGSRSGVYVFRPGQPNEPDYMRMEQRPCCAWLSASVDIIVSMSSRGNVQAFIRDMHPHETASEDFFNPSGRAH